MPYLGNSLSIQQYAPTITYFNGNGSTTAFTLPIPVASAAQVIVHVENVPQNPATAFTISGSTLTFTSAPPTGSNNIWVEYTALQTNTIAPSQGTVQNSSFGSITSIPFVNGGPIGGGNSSLLKNRIINGAMVIDQRNAGASVTPATSPTTFDCDRWSFIVTQASKLTAQQSTTAPTGFNYSQLITSSSAYSVTATDVFELKQLIEGYNVADLGWGTANAKTVTLSFQVYSSLTGTFGGALQNSAYNRSYPFSYSIPVANTWTTISITIPGDTTGTWLTTNGVGIRVVFGLGVGSTYSGTAGSWAGTEYHSATGATSVVGTSGATFYITGVQLEVGTSATGFEYRQYQQELALCQRYYVRYTVVGPAFWGFTAGQVSASTAAYFGYNNFLRATPTVTYNNLYINDTSTNSAVTSVSVPSASNTPSIQFGASGGGLTAGRSALLYCATSAGGSYFDLSAEL